MPAKMKIFISHSSTDKPFVRTLKEDLEINGLRTFVDEIELDFGDNLNKKLSTALEESHVFIIILSPKALESEWVRIELKKAISLSKKNIRKIIPIKYQECAVPDALKEIIHADLSKTTRKVKDNTKVKFIDEDDYDAFLKKLIRSITNLAKSDNTSDFSEPNVSSENSPKKARIRAMPSEAKIATKFGNFLANRISPLISHFSKQKIAWDSSLTIQQVPELSLGWQANEITFKLENINFDLPDDYKKSYSEYYSEREDHFKHDGDKFMLIKRPTSFTDAPSLTLEIKVCKFSQVQYYRDNIAKKSSERNELIQKILNKGDILFPHSLCLHLVIITSDNKVLLTKRSPKVSYYPSKWSASLEEQLHQKDFQQTQKPILQSCIERLFIEEVGITKDKYNLDDFKLLSVFLEADILNVSLCGLIKLKINKQELTSIINFIPRKDDEFNEFELLSKEQVIKELRFHTKELHPSTGYRLLMALYHMDGVMETINRLLKR